MAFQSSVQLKMRKKIQLTSVEMNVHLTRNIQHFAWIYKCKSKMNTFTVRLLWFNTWLSRCFVWPRPSTSGPTQSWCCCSATCCSVGWLVGWLRAVCGVGAFITVWLSQCPLHFIAAIFSILHWIFPQTTRYESMEFREFYLLQMHRTCIFKVNKTL